MGQVSMNGETYLTKENLIIGIEVKRFFQDAEKIFTNDCPDLNKFDVIPKIGGYWEESKGKWLAFDNSGAELFVEEFDIKLQAKLYAMGKYAYSTTVGWI